MGTRTRTMGAGLALVIGIAATAGATLAADATSTAGACEVGRVRKDAKDLTNGEKAAFVSAIHALKASPSPYDPRYTYYDQFVRWHQLAVIVSMEAGGSGIAHHNPAFPPWHRKLLWLYENALCEVSRDPSIALPYWDWTDPRSTAAVLAVDLMGPGGDPDEGYAVTEGPFRRDVWQLDILPFDGTLLSETPEKYLVRAIGIDTANTYRIVLPTIVDVLATLERTTYDTSPWGVDSADSFRNTLEGFVIDPVTGRMDPDQQAMHNIVHDWVGGIFYVSTDSGQLIKRQGTMEPLDVSPNDPIFFLHHANVDRIWAAWQVAHPGAHHYLPTGGEGACPFPDEDDPGPGVALPHVSDREHAMMTARGSDGEPSSGMRLDDHMFPFCLARYAGTLVHADPAPHDQLDVDQLGYTYAELYPTTPG